MAQLCAPPWPWPGDCLVQTVLTVSLCSNTNSSLVHVFSLSSLVPKLPDDLEGISPIAGLGNGGKYTKLGILLSKNKGCRH